MKANRSNQIANAGTSSRLIVKNLPPTFDEKSFKKHFEKFGEVTDCRIIFKGDQNRHFGFIGYKFKDNAEEAHKKLNNSYIAKNKIIIQFAGVKTEGQSNKVVNTNPEDLDPKRLYVYNFPFNVTKEDLESVFGKYGQLTEARILVDRDGKSKGMGFIGFEDENAVIRALAELDNQIVFGRILHIQQCKKSPSAARYESRIEEHKKKEIDAEKTSYKKLKKVQFYDSLSDDTTWNAMFLNPDTVMEVMASKLGIKKKELLDMEIDNPAVLKTQAELETIQQTKDFLMQNNINLEAFKTKPNETIRSSNVILVKNIPYKTNRKQLEELFGHYGQLVKIIIPDNRAIAIIEFYDDEHAKNSFELLSGYKFKGGSPLFLEWAPKDIFCESELLAKRDVLEEDPKEAQPEIKTKSIYVKNLNFSTTEDQLKAFMEKHSFKDIKNVKIVKKNGNSCGFGFIDFETHESVQKAIRELQNKLLDGHSLKLSISQPNKTENLKKRKEVSEAYHNVDKLVLRNIAFQATKQELKDLLTGIVAFKKIRLPKKSTGELRGFAFVEFSSNEECKKAFETLQNLHFYGRKLVIEFAKE